MIITCSVKSGKRVRLCDDFYMNVYVHPLHSVFLINVLKAVENIVLRLLPEVVGLEIFHNVLIGFPQPFEKLVFVASLQVSCHCETSAHTGRGNPLT